jgi:hypothetical protein
MTRLLMVLNTPDPRDQSGAFDALIPASAAARGCSGRRHRSCFSRGPENGMSASDSRGPGAKVSWHAGHARGLSPPRLAGQSRQWRRSLCRLGCRRRPSIPRGHRCCDLVRLVLIHHPPTPLVNPFVVVLVGGLSGGSLRLILAAVSGFASMRRAILTLARKSSPEEGTCDRRA